MTHDDRWNVLIHAIDPDPTPHPRAAAAGAWSVSGLCSASSVRDLTDVAPGVWHHVASVEEEMIDNSGEAVDVEWTAGVHVARGERAVLAWCEHWQAGLYASLTVYATDEAFEHGLAGARAELRDADYDDEEGDGDRLVAGCAE